MSVRVDGRARTFGVVTNEGVGVLGCFLTRCRLVVADAARHGLTDEQLAEQVAVMAAGLGLTAEMAGSDTDAYFRVARRDRRA